MTGWETMVCAALVGTVAASRVPGPHQLELLDEPLLVVRHPDGKLSGWLVRGPADHQVVAARSSTDNGESWDQPKDVLALPAGPGQWLGVEPLLNRDGEMHLFLLRWGQPGTVTAGEGERVLVGQLLDTRLDIWHARSHDGQSRWDTPRLIWKGYTGALNSVIQMAKGRIVLPFSYLTSRNWANRGGGPGEWTFMGQYDCTCVYSDDAGDTWSLADSVRTPVPDIVSAYGAVEPVVIQRLDGRVWMVIRTQLGRLYESFSPDGARWSVPRPTELLSSDSPVGMVRLDDRRLVMFWNNCLRFPYAYGGRHLIHAAISSDDGLTWRGFREVARDPRRTSTPPPNGDFGTAYPFPVVANDGQVIYCTGQGAGRVLLMRLDPDWLLEPWHVADFARREDEWQRFGTRGVDVIPNPDRPDARVLCLRKPEADWPAGATWNFPSGRSGRLEVRLMANARCQDLLVGLTDHFSVPFDDEDEFHNLYNLRLGLTGIDVKPGRWHELELRWRGTERECTVKLDGRTVSTLPLLRETLGACYLRLRSLADGTDRAGWLVASAEVEVE